MGFEQQRYETVHKHDQLQPDSDMSPTSVPNACLRAAHIKIHWDVLF